MAEKIYLLDGSALVYRSHFALARNPLVNSAGQNVSAVFGFAQTLFSIINGEKARYVAVAFDRAEPTFRHDAFEGYKANRPAMPDDLVQQWPLAIELVHAAGVRLVDHEGMEADDVLASLAVAFSRSGTHAVIVSADKDFNPILGPRISQWVPPRGKEPAVMLGPEQVREKWGIECERLLDVFALIGDAVDNVPGVRGIGEKTALELIRQFNGLDELYARLDEVPRPAVREKLIAGRDDAFRSRELIRLRTDLYSDVTIETFAVGDLRMRPELLDVLTRLEFRKMINTLGLAESVDRAGTYDCPATREAMGRMMAELAQCSGPLAIEVFLDDGADPRVDDPIGIALCRQEGRAIYIPFGAGDHAETGFDADLVLEALRPLLEDAGIEKVTPDAKAMLHHLARWGVALRGDWFDVLLASYLLDPDRPADLASLSRELLGLAKSSPPGTARAGRPARLFTAGNPEVMASFAGEEVDVCRRLHGPLGASLRERGQERLNRELEMPLVSVLVDMERAGVHVDLSMLRVLGAELSAETSRLAQEIQRLAGCEFNLNSPSQLGRVLFEHLKLPRGKKTKTGYSTDSEVLEDLAGDQPIARVILEYRQLSKLKSTYVDALPPMTDPETSRIHARFHQTVAATGRLSSSDPNLQNIPIRTPQGRRIRTAFTAQDADHVLISADYSQIELRLLAHLSGDPDLTAAFRSGTDIHRATAARIFDLPPEQIDSAARARAKTVNFGVLYGMGPVRLSRELGISLAAAKGFIEQYFAKMPSVRAFLDENLTRARKEGYVTTLLGRRRYIPGLRLGDPRARSQAERIAANTPIQGSAADLIKKAMVDIHRILSMKSLRTRLVLQVHDELLFEGPASEREGVAGIVREAMESAIDLTVPLVVEVGWGPDWDAAHG